MQAVDLVRCRQSWATIAWPMVLICRRLRFLGGRDHCAAVAPLLGLTAHLTSPGTLQADEADTACFRAHRLYDLSPSTTLGLVACNLTSTIPPASHSRIPPAHERYHRYRCTPRWAKSHRHTNAVSSPSLRGPNPTGIYTTPWVTFWLDQIPHAPAPCVTSHARPFPSQRRLYCTLGRLPAGLPPILAPSLLDNCINKSNSEINISDLFAKTTGPIRLQPDLKKGGS